MTVEIDKNSGFCFGVVRAITTAEKELDGGGTLYCLGDIVHNGREVERLTRMGMITIDHEQMRQLHDARVLLRAHGEPPETYRLARANNIEIIDASCSVVLRLQHRIKEAYTAHPEAQIVIYGKVGHAEVIGLEGQTNGEAIVLESADDLPKIDFARPVILFSQTTKSIDGFNALVRTIESRMAAGVHFEYHDTICRQVANRIPNIRDFAARYDVVLFVAGAKSSNGKVLFAECKSVNDRTYQVSDKEEIKPEWIAGAQSVGICGATSTPKWLMEEVENEVRRIDDRIKTA